jgi:hypothetical protein
LRKFSSRRPMSLDIDHMRMLHEEAIEQLDLMKTALEAAMQARDTIRDNLDQIMLDHWRYYLDVIHMISKHDETITLVFQERGMELSEQEEDLSAREFNPNYTLLLLLLLALSRRHRRIWHVLGLHGEPMTEHLKDSLIMEREHMANLVSMVQSLI